MGLGSLCRVARRKRHWQRAKRRQRKKQAPPHADDEALGGLPFFLDSAPAADRDGIVQPQEDVSFFLDILPDASMLPVADVKSPVAAPEPLPKTCLQLEPPAPQLAVPRDETEDAPLPPAAPLPFTVILSTASEAVEAAWGPPEEPEEEVEHESLDRFYKENEVKRAEQRKRFVQPRYYEGDDKTDQVSSALRTDDGYLTKLGSKIFCMVCFGTGHRAQNCPESRCWVCFATGHNVKNCPRAKEKCESCWRKGHGGDRFTACPFETLKAAQRHRDQWSHVRCAACGEAGHPMCDGSGKPYLGWWDDAEPARPHRDDTQKANRFASALRGSGAWSAGRSNWDEQKWKEKQDSWSNHSSGWKDWDRANHNGWKDGSKHGSQFLRQRLHQGYGGSHRPSSAPNMRIRDKPSARSQQRAAEKLKRALR